MERAESAGPVVFVDSGGSIAVSHLQFLSDHFLSLGLDFDWMSIRSERTAPPIEDGSLVISCNMRVDRWLEPVRDRVFQVQLPHNLTSLKGSNLSVSKADLNVLPGLQFLQSGAIDSADPRFVIGGYAKWDAVYRERFLQSERRGYLSRRLSIEPEPHWVVFYPTGPNRDFSSNVHQACRVYERLQVKLGSLEFFFCNHSRNNDFETVRRDLDRIGELAARDRHVHVVDGADALPYISACDLFITDIASTVITAISMGKPVLFMGIDCSGPGENMVADFQVGPFWHEVDDPLSVVSRGGPTPEQLELFRRCVAFDDDRNCERITETILLGYRRWRDDRVKGRRRG